MSKDFEQLGWFLHLALHKKINPFIRQIKNRERISFQRVFLKSWIIFHMFTFQLYGSVFPSLLSGASLSISCKEFYGCIKVKLNYFVWTCYLNTSWHLLENFKTLHFKNTSVKILVNFILFLCSLRFVMCGEVQVSFCSITLFNFPAESPIPICDPGFPQWHPRWGIVFRWSVNSEERWTPHSMLDSSVVSA